MPRFRTSLLALGLLAGVGGIAWAQMPPGGQATYDPAQLPAISGKVAQYSLTPRGDVDGLILQDGTQVHLPPHLSAQIVYAVRPGDTVTVHGLKAAALPLVQGMSVTNDATHQTVVDTGPGGQQLTAQGRIRMDLYGPRGDLNGVLLDNGTMIHMPPPEAQRLAAQLKPGETIYASGHGMASPLGTVIGAQAIGPNASQTVAIAAPPPPPHGHGHHPPPPPPPAQ